MPIIIGYAGIGKSTLGGRENGFVDLEVTSFLVNGNNHLENWPPMFVRIALDLSHQGYNVLVTGHSETRELFKTMNTTGEKIFMCYPSMHLKDLWVKKLHERYVRTGLRKDCGTWFCAKNNFENHIKELVNDADRLGFTKIELNDFNYVLKDVLVEAIKK